MHPPTPSVKLAEIGMVGEASACVRCGVPTSMTLRTAVGPDTMLGRHEVTLATMAHVVDLEFACCFTCIDSFLRRFVSAIEAMDDRAFEI